MKKAYTVTDYIAGAPAEIQDTLTKLRRVIKKVAPKANERISYGMPFYEYGGTGYNGRLIYFAAFKKHISVFITPRHAKTVPARLEKYHTGKATYQFSLDQPFPFTLVEKTVKALVKERDMQNKKASSGDRKK